MIARVRAALGQRPVIGAVLSLLVHLALIVTLVWTPMPSAPGQKRGDALIVELPNVNEPANVGTPGPEPNAAPIRGASEPKPAPAPRAPAPPRPPAAAPPRPPAVARPPAPPAPSPAPKMAARPAERLPNEQGELPVPKPAPEVAAATPPPTPPTPGPSERAPVEPPQAPPAPPQTAAAPQAPTPPGPVASLPPTPDIRSAFRRGGGGGGSGAGGAGGTGAGRGGIVGEPVALDSKDTDLSDYLERVKRLIKQNWVYPCVKDRATGACEYKSTELIIEFGILKQGPLQYVEVRRTSPWDVYDDSAVTAIKLASPFPPVPPAMMARMARGSTGAAIRARFVYHVDTGLTNLVR